MERKLRNATAKLRNLKDFLSSTRSLSQGQGSSSSSSTNPYHQNHRNHQNNRKSSKGSTGSGLPLSVSLYDLADPSSRPTSMNFTNSFTNGGLPSGGAGTFHHQNPNTSVSMYGLASSEIDQEGRDRETNNLGQTHNSLRPSIVSKNPAMRLFYTIRSKFRRRRRDRISKIVDSNTTDFGPFMSPTTSKSNYVNGNSSGVPSGVNDTSRFQLESSQSVDQLEFLSSGFEDDSFSPLGCRDRNYGKENTEPRLCLSTASSCFVINDNTPRNSGYRTMMDQGGAIHLQSPQERNEPNTSCSRSTNEIQEPSTSVTPSSSSGQPSRQLKGLAKELFDLIHSGWYWGNLSKEEAEEKLRDEPDGAFIVRDSSSSVHILSLSFNSKGKTKHTRIDYVDGKFCFLGSETEAFPSVAELIEHWINNSELGIFCYSKSNRANGPTSYPVRLTKPISRFTEVKSLQFLSSFVLYQYTRLDLIPKLPLPPQLIEFIGQQHYF